MAGQLSCSRPSPAGQAFEAQEAVLFSALEELEGTGSKAKVQSHCVQLGRLYQVGSGAELLLLLPSLGAVCALARSCCPEGLALALHSWPASLSHPPQPSELSLLPGLLS